jgi:Sulfotransferase family
MTMPNFLIIGAAKAATTSLYDYLKDHPDIYMSPVKEPRFFALEGNPKLDRLREAGLDDSVWRGSVTEIDAYRALFDGAGGAIAIGEASPIYLAWSAHSARTIRRHVPEAKLIACLRDPVDRAFSHYCHNLKIGAEHRTRFEEVLGSHDAVRMIYLAPGLYHRDLSNFYEQFPREQILVCFFEEIGNDPGAVLDRIFRFLGVDPDFRPTLARHNAGKQTFYRENWLSKTLPSGGVVGSYLRGVVPRGVKRRLAATLLKPVEFRPTLSAATRRELVDFYRDDVLRLQGLLGRDLSAWLRREPDAGTGSGPAGEG